MAPYVRPPIPQQTFYDANGEVIPYGSRWPDHIAPKETYSVVSNPQRFAALHTIADALIAHLQQTYDVAIEEDLALASDLMRKCDNAIRAVRVTPNRPDAAAMTFVYTAFPGIIIHAGLLQDFIYPDCGCDACDETAETEAGEMEWRVLAVAAGNYSEAVEKGTHFGLEVIHELRWPGDDQWSRGRRGLGQGEIPPERLNAAIARLKELPDGWQEWPLQA